MPFRSRIAWIQCCVLLASGALVPARLDAQTPSDTAVPALSIRVTTRMVLVDLVVTDKHGAPVSDLTAEDLTILEDKKPERISLFSHYVQSAQPTEKTQPPPLAPNVYTNRPEYHQPPGPLVLLLVDGLNTAMADQVSSRAQILRYLRSQLRPEQRVAVLGLSGNLILLQDFTSDPGLLISALQKYSPSKSVPLSRGQPVMITPLMASMMYRPALQALIDFNQARAVESIDDRVRLTLEALQAIARSMLGYPGRKNLVWVSSAFPFSLLLDGDDRNLARNYTNEVRQTATLLAEAQVSVYTVDARGLVGGSATQSNPNELVPTIESPDQPIVGETEITRSPLQLEGSHSAMQELAQQTGGRAFYNANELDKAIANSIADGSSYYTVGYYPQNKTWDGKFRRIEIKTHRKGIAIRARQGYFAFDTAQTSEPAEHDQKRFSQLLTAVSSPLPATGVTFQAQFAPGASSETASAVEFLVDTNSIAFEEASQGHQHCNLDFAIFSIAADGKILDRVGKTLDANLEPAQYAGARGNGLPFKIPVNLSPESRQLLLAVRDNRTGFTGTLAIPVSADAK